MPKFLYILFPWDPMSPFKLQGEPSVTSIAGVSNPYWSYLFGLIQPGTVPWYFPDLRDFWRLQDYYFIDCLSTGICLCYFLKVRVGLYLLQDDHWSRGVLLRHPLCLRVIYVWLWTVTGDVSLDLLTGNNLWGFSTTNLLFYLLLSVGILGRHFEAMCACLIPDQALTFCIFFWLHLFLGICEFVFH